MLKLPHLSPAEILSGWILDPSESSWLMRPCTDCTELETNMCPVKSALRTLTQTERVNCSKENLGLLKEPQKGSSGFPRGAGSVSSPGACSHLCYQLDITSFLLFPPLPVLPWVPFQGSLLVILCVTFWKLIKPHISISLIGLNSS